MKYAAIQFRDTKKKKHVYFYGSEKVVKAKFLELKPLTKSLNIWSGDYLGMRSFKDYASFNRYIQFKKGIEGIVFIELTDKKEKAVDEVSTTITK
ncbi:hypothetical protein [Paenibacillus alkalitolerans]|uniref:hypothetical protein n=1 Tax=Paenibacillus alkalitolerans TaxID=2799335 RepID=UPI0018F39E35|nr:hypothetical protein [Paenibacillus alkalitolerans]